MEFTFGTRTGKRFTATAKTAEQGAKFAAYKLWQNAADELPRPQSHAEVQVEHEDVPGYFDYGVSYKAPGETRAYTRATILKLIV